MVFVVIGQMTVLEDLVRQLEDIVRSARNVPLSASAMIDRKEVLNVVELLKRSIPEEIARETLWTCKDFALATRDGIRRMPHMRQSSSSSPETTLRSSRARLTSSASAATFGSPSRSSSSRAVAAPMPRLAPVTMHALSERPRSKRGNE